MENNYTEKENIITIKVKYSFENFNRLKDYIKNYNNVLRFTYNRLLDSDEKLSTKELTVFQKGMNNVFVDSHFLNSAQFEAKALISKNDKTPVVFGGRKLARERTKKTIEKAEYQDKKLLPLCSIGEATRKGNRKFQILSENEVLFKPNKNEHFILVLQSVGKNYQKLLLQLEEIQKTKTVPITYKLGLEYIYISFDLNKLKSEVLIRPKKEDRYFAIDLNPNYIGWSVVDWLAGDTYKIIDKGVISIKPLNDYDNSLKGKSFNSESKERKYITEKRKYEIIKTSHFLVSLANHYKCNSFILESLDMKGQDLSKGKRLNKLVNNQWNRNLFYNQIKKKCSLLKINFIEVLANYSSFLGNLVYREEKLPDMVLASIEISRRGYEFYHQYLKKDKEKIKNIILGNFEVIKNKMIKSLEELNYFVTFESTIELYKEVKKARLKYRFPLNENDAVFSKLNKRGFKIYYKF